MPAPEAWTALNAGDAGRAAGLFREAIERSPRDPILHFGAGWAAYALGRNDAAISSLKKALEFNADFAQAAALLGTVAYASSDLDLAIRSMEKAAALAPRDPGIRRQLEQWRKESTLHAGFDQRTGVRFRVLFEGAQQQALGVRVEQVLESAYWSIGKTLNSYPSDTLMVVLYTNKQFQDVTRAPAWAGGEFDGRIRLAVGGAMRTPGALDRVVRHELVHAIIQHAAPRNVPTWVNEGLASVLESTDRTWVRRVLSESREIFRLEDLGRRIRPPRWTRGTRRLRGERRGRADSDRAARSESGAVPADGGHRPHRRSSARHAQCAARGVPRRVAQAGRGALT